MTNKKSRTKEPDSGSLEVTEELIRQCAYGYYEERGREDGHDLEDWFRAEAEIGGKKTSDSETVLETTATSSVAA
jgi:Protein of unknown function (DUF2934)